MAKKSYLTQLGDAFIKSAVRQTGRDLGKIVSNKVYGDAHSTPIRNVSSSTTDNYCYSSTDKLGGYDKIEYTCEEQLKDYIEHYKSDIMTDNEKVEFATYILNRETTPRCTITTPSYENYKLKQIPFALFWVIIICVPSLFSLIMNGDGLSLFWLCVGVIATIISYMLYKNHNNDVRTIVSRLCRAENFKCTYNATKIPVKLYFLDKRFKEGWKIIENEIDMKFVLPIVGEQMNNAVEEEIKKIKRSYQIID